MSDLCDAFAFDQDYAVADGSAAVAVDEGAADEGFDARGLGQRGEGYAEEKEVASLHDSVIMPTSCPAIECVRCWRRSSRAVILGRMGRFSGRWLRVATRQRWTKRR